MFPRPVKCGNPRCTKSFTYRKGKRYCDEACKEAGRRAKQALLGHELFRKSVLISPLDTEEAAEFKGNEWMVGGPMIGITKNVPTRAIGYRLGAPKLGVASHGEWALRWFPTYRMFPQGVFLMKPFQSPLVPHAGEYLIAHFDAKFLLIEPPYRRIEIHLAWSRECWSQGDPRMEIRPERQYT